MGGDPGGWGRRGDKGGELLAASWVSHPVGGGGWGCTPGARCGSTPGGPGNRTTGVASFHPSAPGPTWILAMPVLLFTV